MVTETVMDTAEGFLGVTNPEHRAEAMMLPIEKLAARLRERLAKQAGASRHFWALLEMAEESLPNNTDNDKTEWKYVAKGTCEKVGGSSKAPK